MAIWRTRNTNISAATRYYPDEKIGLDTSRFEGVAIHINTASGVTITVQAVLFEGTEAGNIADDYADASLPWVDVTKACVSLLTGFSGNASFVDQADILHLPGKYRLIRVKSVTSDATNTVDVAITPATPGFAPGIPGKLLDIPVIPSAITPSDATDVSTLTTKGLIVTVAGNLLVRGTGAPSTTVTLVVVAGQYVPIQCSRVMAATTATVVGLS